MKVGRASEIIENFKQNQKTEQHLGRIWIRNLFRNYLRLSNTSTLAHNTNEQQSTAGGNLYSCSDLFSNLPVILIGAGISLETEIEHIRTLVDSYCIIAVDTALPILHAHNITPDMIVALESQVYNMRDFACGVDSHTIIASDLTAHPSLLRIMNSRGSTSTNALFSSQFSDITLLRLLNQHKLRPLVIPALGSVGVVALYIALTITKREVYIVGLDFNYQMGKTHCRGAPFITNAQNIAHILNPDPVYRFCIKRSPLNRRNKNGASSRTDPTLISQNKVLQKVCHQYNRIYDCGHKGLYMHSQRALLQELPHSTDISLLRKNTTHKNDQTHTTATAHKTPATDTEWPVMAESFQSLSDAKERSTQSKIRIKKNATCISYASISRTFMHTIHRQITALLALDEQQYANLFPSHDILPVNSKDEEIANLDFLALDHHERIPLAQHYRYSAIDYYRRLTRYLQCCF